MDIKRLNAGVILIGDELLSGQTQDTNLSAITQHLNTINVPLHQCIIIPDDHDIIVNAVRDYAQKFKYVLTTGGIGPTHDDLTTEAVAQAFNRKLILNQSALNCFPNYKKNLYDALRMSTLPEGCRLIRNTASYAPGFIVENVYVMAGVPHIMNAMMNEIVKLLVPGHPIYQQQILTHAHEGQIADKLHKTQQQYPAVKIGSYPSYKSNKSWCLKIVLKSPDSALLSLVVDQVVNICRLFDLNTSVIKD